MAFLDWLLDRLQEPSTWRGIIQALTAAGIVIDPSIAIQIIAIGTALVGLINILRREPPREAP